MPADRTAVLPVEAGDARAALVTRTAPRMGPWVWWILAALAAAAAIMIIAFVLVGGDATPDRPNQSPLPTQTQPEPSPTVPAVIGLRLNDALKELAAVGVEEARIEPVPGERRIVLDVDPAEGSTLTIDQPVTLFVGNGEEGDEGDD
jgi:hypothetical protein